MRILDHIIGLFVDVLAKDIFFLSFSFKLSRQFYIYFAFIAFFSFYSSTLQVLLSCARLNGPTVSCFRFIFYYSLSTFTSGSTTIFYFFLLPPYKMFLDSLNLLFRALTISSISLVAFYSFKLDYFWLMSGSSRLKEKNFLLL